jgi:hypothetical protein
MTSFLGELRMLRVLCHPQLGGEKNESANQRQLFHSTRGGRLDRFAQGRHVTPPQAADNGRSIVLVDWDGRPLMFWVDMQGEDWRA